MRRLALFAVLLGGAAHAGDRYLGTITSAGTSINEHTTATPFAIPINAKLTVQCDATAYINTDTGVAVTSSNGVKVQTDAAWQTSVGSQTTIFDGGLPVSGIVNVISVSGTVNCKVFERKGTE